MSRNTGFKALLFAALWFFAVASVPAEPVVNIEILPQTPGPTIGEDFVGLSFETRDVLADANGNHFFSPDNTRLIATFKALGIKSLRIGGNTADRATIPMPTTADVDSLFLFAKKADVKVIYTLRLNQGNAEAAAKMAGYIQQHYAKQLDCFVIGNEPNTYFTNYLTYFTQWKAYAAEITAPTNVPEARFCGPSVSPGHEKWSAQLAADLVGNAHLKFISQHDYPGGDARRVTNAAAGRDKILSPSMDAHYKTFASHFIPAVISNGYACRLEEANSLYDGGAEGVSDTFASALWALDYEWWWASRGIMGINFHTGDHVATRDESKPCHYATFWSTPDGYNVHPIGYAEKMFSLGGRGRILPVNILPKPEMDPKDLNFAAYAVLGGDKIFYLTLINRSHDASATNLSVMIGAQGIDGWSKGEVIRLTAPDGDVSRKTGVTLGGAEIADDAHWDGKWQTISVSSANLQFPIEVELPAASAAVVKLMPK